MLEMPISWTSTSKLLQDNLQQHAYFIINIDHERGCLTRAWRDLLESSSNGNDSKTAHNCRRLRNLKYCVIPLLSSICACPGVTLTSGDRRDVYKSNANDC